jgi:hypothetical protein
MKQGLGLCLRLITLLMACNFPLAVKAQTLRDALVPGIQGQVQVLAEPIEGIRVWLLVGGFDPTFQLGSLVTDKSWDFDSLKVEKLFEERPFLVTLTNANGNFAFNKLDYGSYWLITLSPRRALNSFFIRHISLEELVDQGIVESKFNFIKQH